MFKCYTGVTNTDEGSSTIPQYLICPLTRPLFEDPVTLETGQTFERAAIQKWFDEGNKTCPVTGNSLECLSVPLANMVIKCVIDSWKSKHCKNILAFASQMMEEKEGREFAHSDDGFISILEQLITIYSREERIVNVKHLISLGSVQYLIRRFVLGTTEEKIRGAGHLICCIEADASCRDRIAKAINIQVLIEFLHSKQIEARTNAVPLLTELVCPKR
ncbi:putative E3 ubiquitin-protein ligase LIN isoform X2 [Punica granatum]|uniref:E3 ubiquitin-protein ligase LIN isoform X2 n=1 Tax=Punica granatum TaxID=22663 RepID=A0A6P8E3R9_PUNGR|nr:putative E3 ubiquitin-protein ligase LIN isoform X2 [Punica granatum]